MRGSSIAFGIAVSLATIVGACDDGNPTPENTVRPSGIPVHSLTGFVTEPVGVAVEGAAVTVLDGPYKGKSTITDRAGGYALIGLDGGFTIQVTKDGYGSEAKGVSVTSDPHPRCRNQAACPQWEHRWRVDSHFRATFQLSKPVGRKCQDVSRIHRPAGCGPQHQSVGRALRRSTTTDRHHP